MTKSSPHRALDELIVMPHVEPPWYHTNPPYEAGKGAGPYTREAAVYDDAAPPTHPTGRGR